MGSHALLPGAAQYLLTSINIYFTLKYHLMLWCAIKDNTHNLGVNEGQGMYWQGADNTHRRYGLPDEGPRQLAEGVPHACIARRA